MVVEVANEMKKEGGEFRKGYQGEIQTVFIPCTGRLHDASPRPRSGVCFLRHGHRGGADLWVSTAGTFPFSLPFTCHLALPPPTTPFLTEMVEMAGGAGRDVRVPGGCKGGVSEGFGARRPAAPAVVVDLVEGCRFYTAPSKTRRGADGRDKG